MPTWIRVRDEKTGHEYDVEKSSLRPGMTPLEDYPAISGPGAQARPAKPRIDKTGEPKAVAGSAAKEPAAQPEKSKKE